MGFLWVFDLVELLDNIGVYFEWYLVLGWVVVEFGLSMCELFGFGVKLVK